MPNPSFEEYKRCPRNTADIGVLKDWYQPTAGTTDYFNVCAERTFAGVPHNIFGYQQAHNGNGYIGLATRLQNNYREYISVKLKSSLKDGMKYVVKFFVSLANTSQFCASDIQVLFSPSPVKLFSHYNMKYDAQLNSDCNAPIKDTANWTEVKWVYTAKGDEKFMTIGNFYDDKRTGAKKMYTKKSMPFASYDGQIYYYIDDVCVSAMNADSSCNCNEEQDTVKELAIKKDTSIIAPPVFLANKEIVLDNIFFETGMAILLPSSFAELDKLAMCLLSNAASSIEINGYTDADGTEKNNKQLSYARAKAVANYLMLKGISDKRISYNGLGSINPIASNNTIEGKAMNRRVEFKIIQ
ncbi:MAG TPA: OmpA family protein [Bacteroidia bacterium]|nr:OmpA family protein [Bacteroidia bacterium]